MAQKKIGIMGGTFDPVHIGHLILGEAAYQQFGLNSVWFMPAGNPPHKQNRTGRAGGRTACGDGPARNIHQSSFRAFAC